MAKIQFFRKEVRASLLDPNEGFTRKEFVFEVRKDPLTGHVSRILPFRFKFPQTQILTEVIKSSRENCPFCPDRILSTTPQFVPEIISEGRICRGRAMLFPNSFPYAQWNWVVVLSEEHFLHLDQFSVEILRDGFLVGQEGIEKLEQVDDNYNYVSINWNYLPQAGGGIIHPHLQVIVEDSPAASQKNVLKGLKRYQMEGGQSFWDDFFSKEIRINERYVGKEGDIHFLTSFSPSGILGEILFLFSNKTTIKELTIKDWEDFPEGLMKVFLFLKGKHIPSFNLAVFSGSEEGVESWVYGRLCPRMSLPPWNTSDINYFEKLHDEVICAVSSEEICKEIKLFFCQDPSIFHHGKETLDEKDRAKDLS